MGQSYCPNINGATLKDTRKPLKWRHNGRDGVSNHQPHNCLLNRLFGRRSNKTSKLRVTGLCAGNSPGTGEFPAQRASNAENVSIWWSHHANHLHVVNTENKKSQFDNSVFTGGTVSGHNDKLRCHQWRQCCQTYDLFFWAGWRSKQTKAQQNKCYGHAAWITGSSTASSTDGSNYQQRKYQSFALLALCKVSFPHKGPAMRELFPCYDVIMALYWRGGLLQPVDWTLAVMKYMKYLPTKCKYKI